MPAASASRRVTVATIAAAAGVSTATVSKVLNGRADVSPATRAHIQRMLSDHNYVKTGADRRVGLLDMAFRQLDGPWATEMIRGAEEVARAANIGLVLVVLEGSDTAVNTWLDSLAGRGSEGVILGLPSLSRAHLRRLALLDIRVIMVDPTGEFDPDIPSVGASNWTGAMAATSHLLGLGHQRIATITGPRGMLCSQARYDGYRTCLERAELAVDSRYVREGDFRQPSGLAAAADLLDLPDPPTAIFAANDEQALGVYEAARRRGLRIPDDLSVVGFDDIPMARWAGPPLTTVGQPLAEMAALAARILTNPPDGSVPANRRIELSTHLVVRESTAGPAH